MSVFICIDLKSFYASVECVERGLNPLTTNLVVADESRTDKTICLAVSPSLKKRKISGRARLFEVKQRIKEIKKETGETVEFIIAQPQMEKYEKISANIYEIYLKYIAAEDIHVYSIDEVFIDVSAYLNTYKMNAHQIAIMLIKDVLASTGITATAGIGENMYLAKVAMDIVAKHTTADKDGVRIAELNKEEYKKQLWKHLPLTDFWGIGSGISKRLAKHDIYTMGDIARVSIDNEDLLYKILGINAEILIDHAWGEEPTRMKDIKSYRSSSTSLSSGQVLSKSYSYTKAKVVIKEMAEKLTYDMLSKNLMTTGITLDIGYDSENVDENYTGPIQIDHYGRAVPKSAHGSYSFKTACFSENKLVKEVADLFDRIVNKDLTIRRLNLAYTNLKTKDSSYQISIFDNLQNNEKEEALQDTILKIRRKYGNNSLLKGTNLEEGATGIERNKQIGGHKK